MAETSYPSSDIESAGELDFANDWLQQAIFKQVSRGAKLRERKLGSLDVKSKYSKPPTPARSKGKDRSACRKPSPSLNRSNDWDRLRGRARSNSPFQSTRTSTPLSRRESSSTSARRGRPVCSMRISELAVPTKRQCIDTWRKKASILPEPMIHRLKQQVMDQTPIVKVSDAVNCFRQSSSSTSKKRPPRKINKEAMINRNKLETQYISTIFGHKIAQKLIRPVNARLNSQLQNVSSVVSSEICNVMRDKTKLKTDLATHQRMVRETADKVTIWIANILEETSEKLLEEDLKVKKFHERASFVTDGDLITVIGTILCQEAELEEQEGPALDIIDDLVDNVMNVCGGAESDLEDIFDAATSLQKSVDNMSTTDYISVSSGNDDETGPKAISPVQQALKEYLDLVESDIKPVEESLKNDLMKQLNEIIDRNVIDTLKSTDILENLGKEIDKQTESQSNTQENRPGSFLLSKDGQLDTQLLVENRENYHEAIILEKEQYPLDGALNKLDNVDSGPEKETMFDETVNNENNNDTAENKAHSDKIDDDKVDDSTFLLADDQITENIDVQKLNNNDDDDETGPIAISPVQQGLKEYSDLDESDKKPVEESLKNDLMKQLNEIIDRNVIDTLKSTDILENLGKEIDKQTESQSNTQENRPGSILLSKDGQLDTQLLVENRENYHEAIILEKEQYPLDGALNKLDNVDSGPEKETMFDETVNNENNNDTAENKAHSDKIDDDKVDDSTFLLADDQITENIDVQKLNNNDDDDETGPIAISPVQQGLKEYSDLDESDKKPVEESLKNDLMKQLNEIIDRNVIDTLKSTDILENLGKEIDKQTESQSNTQENRPGSILLSKDGQLDTQLLVENQENYHQAISLEKEQYPLDGAVNKLDNVDSGPEKKAMFDETVNNENNNDTAENKAHSDKIDDDKEDDSTFLLADDQITNNIDVQKLNNNEEEKTDEHKEQKSNMSAELFDDRDKKLQFSYDNFGTLTEFQPHSNEKLPEQATGHLKQGINIGQSNDNSLRNVDEPWPEDLLPEKISKPGESVSKSVTSLGKILESDERNGFSPEETLSGKDQPLSFHLQPESVEQYNDFGINYEDFLHNDENNQKEKQSAALVEVDHDNLNNAAEPKHDLGDRIEIVSGETDEHYSPKQALTTTHQEETTNGQLEDTSSESKPHNKESIDQQELTAQTKGKELEASLNQLKKEIKKINIQNELSELPSLVSLMLSKLQKHDDKLQGMMLDREHSYSDISKMHTALSKRSECAPYSPKRKLNGKIYQRPSSSEEMAARKFDYRVHPSTAPSWIRRGRGQGDLGGGPRPQGYTDTNGLRERELEIRKRCKDLDKILMNLEKWKSWLEYITKYITSLKYKAELNKPRRTNKTITSERPKPPRSIEKEMWTKLNHRAKGGLKLCKNDETIKFKISPTAAPAKYCFTCGRKQMKRFSRSPTGKETLNTANR